MEGKNKKDGISREKQIKKKDILTGLQNALYEVKEVKNSGNTLQSFRRFLEENQALR